MEELKDFTNHLTKHKPILDKNLGDTIGELLKREASIRAPYNARRKFKYSRTSTKNRNTPVRIGKHLADSGHFSTNTGNQTIIVSFRALNKGFDYAVPMELGVIKPRGLGARAYKSSSGGQRGAMYLRRAFAKNIDKITRMLAEKELKIIKTMWGV